MMHRRAIAIAAATALIACTEPSAPSPPPPVDAIRITPDSTFVYVHGATQLTAVTYDASGHPLSGRPITWSSGDTTIATVDSTGLVRGVKEGSVYVRAAAGGQHAIARIDAKLAIAQLVVSPKRLVIGVPDTFQMSGQVLDSTGQLILGRVVSWTSTDPSIASVTAVGRVIGHTLGVVRLTGSSEGFTDTAHVIVGIPVDSLHIYPTSILLHRGDSLQLRDTVFGRGGQPPSDSTVTWTSSDLHIVVISGAGMLRARATGAVDVTVSAGGAHAQAHISVGVPTATVTVSPADTSVLVGDLASFVSVSRDSQGNTLTELRELCTYPGCKWTYPMTLSSLDTTVDQFVGCCTVRARSAGVDTITAVSDGVTGRAVLHVGFLGFTSVSVGYASACGLAVDSVAYCWTAGHPVHGPTIRLTSLSGGPCGLSPAGDAYCLRDTAVAMGQGHTYSSLAVGYTFVCGLDSGGQAWCWYGGSAGQLGNGDTVYTDTPVAVAGGHTFIGLSAGSDHACAIANDSSAYCWGSNGGGMLGAGDTSVHLSTTPVLVAGGLTFKTISAGVGYTCAITTTDDAYCWGGNESGDLGTGDSVSSSVPRLVVGGLKYKTIAAGWHHTCAVSTTGVGYCWGGDGYLGTGSFGPSASPALIDGNLTFQSIGVTSSGYVLGSCGLTSDGVYCWGNELTGNGAALSPSPVKVQGQPGASLTARPTQYRRR